MAIKLVRSDFIVTAAADPKFLAGGIQDTFFGPQSADLQAIQEALDFFSTFDVKQLSSSQAGAGTALAFTKYIKNVQRLADSLVEAKTFQRSTVEYLRALRAAGK